MTTRSTAIAHFIRQHGWENAQHITIAGDASNRRYERLVQADGASVILMDAPEERGEDVRPFVRIAKHLTAIGLSAPQIIAQDEANGLLLIEDFGNDLFARLLERDLSLEPTLYKAATDTLIALHRAKTPSLNAYDTPPLIEKAVTVFEWYLKGATGHENPDAQAQFTALFTPLCKELDATKPVLIQRDYHAENLLWLPDRTGPARVGLLDFQDATTGHPAYDLVSILQDARRDVSPEIETQMIAYYIEQQQMQPEAFRRDYAVLGVQRNLRIIGGAFSRLCLEMGRPGYLHLIPRVWNLVQRNLAHPALSEVAEVLNNALPPPTPEILERIRLQCPTPQTQ